jgi:hypothetical protein
MNRIGNVVGPARPVLWKSLLLAVTLVSIAALTALPAAAQAITFRDNVRVPFETIVFVPCAAGGAGEEVFLSGSIHLLFVTTIDAGGGFHSKFHFQPQGVSGFGLITGDKYQGTGVTQGHFNGKVGVQDTFVNNFRIIGQGPGNNFMIHETFHVTINANGEVTAFVDNFRVTCRSVSYP